MRSDDLDGCLQQAAQVDEASVERVVSSALAAGADTRLGRSAGIGERLRSRGLLVGCVVMLATILLVLFAWRHDSRTAREFNVQVDGGVVALRAADGTTWILAGGPAAEPLPAGTCIVVGAGGTQ